MVRKEPASAGFLLLEKRCTHAAHSPVRCVAWRDQAVVRQAGSLSPKTHDGWGFHQPAFLSNLSFIDRMSIQAATP